MNELEMTKQFASHNCKIRRKTKHEPGLAILSIYKWNLQLYRKSTFECSRLRLEFMAPLITTFRMHDQLKLWQKNPVNQNNLRP